MYEIRYLVTDNQLASWYSNQNLMKAALSYTQPLESTLLRYEYICYWSGFNLHKQ